MIGTQGGSHWLRLQGPYRLERPREALRSERLGGRPLVGPKWITACEAVGVSSGAEYFM